LNFRTNSFTFICALILTEKSYLRQAARAGSFGISGWLWQGNFTATVDRGFGWTIYFHSIDFTDSSGIICSLWQVFIFKASVLKVQPI
jgi:hypothetical protein